MSRRIAISAVLAGLVALLVFIILKRASKKATVAPGPQMAISDATSTACEASARGKLAADGFCRALVVQLLPSSKADLPALRLNAENLAWDQTENVMREVLRTRIDRTVFLKLEPGISPDHRSTMINLLRQARAERICVIDPNNPPKWYPPRCPPMPTAQ